MNSTTRTLTCADLDRFLTQIGFIAERTQPEYLLFRHAHPDVLLLLPPRGLDDLVDAAHLAAVRTHILENGLLDTESFARLLWGTEPTIASQ